MRLATASPETHLTPRLWNLSPGARVLWKSPRGSFTIAPDSRRLLLIAGGTGLAPFISYVRHLRAAASRRPIVLCHGARHVSELGYRDVLEELERCSREEGRKTWDFRYLPTVSRPQEEENTGWEGHVGRVETCIDRPQGAASSPVERVLEEPLEPSTTSAYVCGFDRTIAAVLARLEPLGFRTRAGARPDGTYDVRFESYG